MVLLPGAFPLSFASPRTARSQGKRQWSLRVNSLQDSVFAGLSSLLSLLGRKLCDVGFVFHLPAETVVPSAGVGGQGPGRGADPSPGCQNQPSQGAAAGRRDRSGCGCDGRLVSGPALPDMGRGRRPRPPTRASLSPQSSWLGP